MAAGGSALERALAPLFALSLRAAQAMAALCCALLAVVAAAIVYDVSVRTLGRQPPNFTVSFTEYVLLYVMMLGAPYMTRHKGHIVVEALIESVPPKIHVAMAKAVYLVCTVVSAGLAWYGGKLAWASFATGDMEYRSFDMPRWILDVTLPLGFGFTAIEFLRYLVTDASLYRVKAQEKDGF
ncbi:MAG TPA: TRAP transporter small permease [Alphaproteobacteria bacterium]|jgi:TRAP-type C4-dicarboxylate transport system permease small subunit